MNKGFAALLTSIIISFILLATAISANRKAFYYEQSLLLDEYKTQSVLLAQSCINAGIVRILQNASYAPNGDELHMLGGICYIKNINGDEEKEIVVQAIYKDAYTNLKAVFDLKDLDKGFYSVYEF